MLRLVAKRKARTKWRAEKQCFVELNLFDDFVLSVDADDGGLPRLGFFRRHRCVGHDNNQVTGLY